MKTTDEIKTGLDACGVLDGDCENCPYDDGPQLLCADRLRKDAIAYIQQLETRLAQAERERDELFMYVPHDCTTCRFELTCERSDECNGGELWKWRGVCEENTKEGNTDHDT